MSFHMPATIANAVDLDNSMRLFADSYGCCPIVCMDISEIRRRNLRAWIDEDPASQGNVEAWCKHYSSFADKPINPTYIRQLAPAQGAPARNIGERAARKFEAIGKKPANWLDRPPTSYDESEMKDVYPSVNTTQEPTSIESIAPLRTAWPFTSIELARYQALPAADRNAIEHAVRAMIIDAETRADKRLASNGH